MKNKQSFFRILLGGAIVLSAFSCDKESNSPQPKPDGKALLENFNANIEELTQEFTVDAAGATVTGTQGTVITFYGDFLNQQDQPVTGTVNIELIEIYGKVDMILTKTATNGRMADGTISTLISGGEFFINATQGGQQLKLSGGFSIAAPAEKTGGVEDGMFLFRGVEACEGDKCELVWEQQLDKRVEAGQGQGTGGQSGDYYYAFQSQFGWTNIDKWYSDPRPKTTIFVDVPEGYDNSNCAIFISYDGEPNALARMDVYNEGTGLFTEHYGLIPVGLDVHFIFVSIVNGQWKYAIQGATIGENHTEVIGNVQTVTEAQLKVLINGMP